jgi:predicted O-methyltransferase YrrM
MSRSPTPDAALRYIAETFVQEDALLQRIRMEGDARRPGMQVGPVEGRLLQVLARLVGARHILEIGTFVGYSTVWLARALPEDGHLHTLEADATHAALARAFFAASDVAGRITLHEGKALEVLPRLDLPMLDLVFIDAMKREYADYLTLIEDKVRPGGLILGDNSLLFGAMYGEPREQISPSARQAMHEFNQRLSDPARYDAILLPTSEGLTVARRRSS